MRWERLRSTSGPRLTLAQKSILSRSVSRVSFILERITVDDHHRPTETPPRAVPFPAVPYGPRPRSPPHTLTSSHERPATIDPFSLEPPPKFY